MLKIPVTADGGFVWSCYNCSQVWILVEDGKQQLMGSEEICTYLPIII